MSEILKYKFDAYEADIRAAELRRRGTRLKLQMQPFQVLVALLERPNEVVTREELRQRLWPQDTFVDFDHSLNTAVAKLRDVLADSAASPRYIETIAKRGYRFLAGVEQIEAASPAQAGQPKTEIAPPATTVLPRVANEAPAQPATALRTDAHPELPRASRSVSRLLFVLAQIMYVVFYLSALSRLDNLHRSAYMAWHNAGEVAFIAYLVTALVGLVVRLYLITATAFDYHLLQQKYRVLFPALLVLDMLWALAPLLLADRMGMGLALAATAALIYMPFAQRVLMKMIATAG